jgi:hypothetical protein
MEAVEEPDASKEGDGEADEEEEAGLEVEVTVCRNICLGLLLRDMKV